VILLHSQERGKALVEELGRAAQLKVAQGVPAHVIPLSLWHTASLGWTSGSVPSRLAPARSWCWSRPKKRRSTSTACRAQMAVAQAILNGLGYTGTHLQLLRAASPTDLDAGCRRWPLPCRR
jgi:hypothetical protein